jgi:predicted aspartyl protease
MGLVRVTAVLESEAGKRVERSFLVDTGSFYSAINQELRDELQLPRGFPTQVIVADGRIIDTELVFARMRILDRAGVIPVEVANVPEPLLGISALETLGFKVNPITRVLEHDRPYGPPPNLSGFIDRGWTAR